MTPTGALLATLSITFVSARRYVEVEPFASPARRLSHSVVWHVADGEGALRLDGTAVPIGPGSIAFLPQGARFQFRLDRPPFRLDSLNFDAALPTAPRRRWSELLRLPTAHAFAPATVEAVSRLVGELVDGATATGGVAALFARADTERVVAHLLADMLAGAEAGTVSLFPDVRMSALAEYIALRRGKVVANDELCAIAGVSPAQLRRLFVRHTGSSPQRYILGLKIEEARERLESGLERVSAIAFSLGFGDAKHFSRVFRQAVGQSPAAYRRRGREWPRLPSDAKG